MTSRLRFVELLLVWTVVLSFVDESVRKVILGTPVYVTAGKLFFALLAGIIVAANQLPRLTAPMMAFLPWSLLVMASSFFVASNYDAPQIIPAVLGTYAAAPFYFAAGYYLGTQPEALKRIGRLYIIGCVLAILVAVLQEFGRGLLPAFLAAHIYKEKHSEAGGDYVESLFASPMILAQVMYPMLGFSFMYLLHSKARQRRLLAALGVCFCGFTIYLSRIRIGAAIIVVVLFYVLLLAKKTGLSFGKLATRIIAAGFVLSILFTVLVVLVPEERFSTKGERDRTFFSKLLHVGEFTSRLAFWKGEIANLPDHDPILGYGVGTSGAMRTVIGDIRLTNIPAVNDTGIAMIYQELGVVGCLIFSLAYILPMLVAQAKMIQMRKVPPEAVVALGVYWAYMGWFLFKAHSVISNGISQVIWLGLLGICFASMNRQEAEDEADRLSLEHSWFSEADTFAYSEQ